MVSPLPALVRRMIQQPAASDLRPNGLGRRSFAGEAVIEGSFGYRRVVEDLLHAGSGVSHGMKAAKSDQKEMIPAGGSALGWSGRGESLKPLICSRSR
jgi:hypothetical protein